jgi:hypothetical protein
MSAKWEYLYEPFSRTYAQFTEHFNAHLNGRAAEGWDLVSAQTGFEGQRAWAALIWRRSGGV